MELGIGLPATIPDVDGGVLVEWARRAEERGFASLGVIDRLAYGNVEPLVALAAAAAVTDRVRLTTSILLAPLHANAALLAKQVASIDRLSGGRLTLGLAVGARRDDYEVSGLDPSTRGRRFDALLTTVTSIWSGVADEPAHRVGPRPLRAGGPELLFGGQSAATFRRVVRYGGGWISGGGGPAMFRTGARRARDAWAESGREGRPRLVALAYFALGPDARRSAEGYLRDFYAFLGPMADEVASGAIVSAEQAREVGAAFEAAGCDELLLFPCDPDLGQVDRLADALDLEVSPPS